MRYPKFLQKGEVIGVCAPSLGCSSEPYYSRAKNAEKVFEKLGHKTIFCDTAFTTHKARSSSAIQRANDFMDMYEDEDISAIISMAGGEFMTEILPYIDFEKIKKLPPKFFCGASDNTTLTFTLTTKCDIATLFGICYPNYGMKPWHQAVKYNYGLLTGKQLDFDNYNKYEIENEKRKMEGYELVPYNCTEKVKWEILTGEKEVEVTGRIIGGTLDILTLLCGTNFSGVEGFNERYAKDGIIWYLESCDLSILEQTRAIWQLKQNGWFKNVKAFILGRPKNTEECFDIDYKEANMEHLKDFGVPVVMNFDVGHVAPAIPILNGAIATLKTKNGKGNIKFQLK